MRYSFLVLFILLAIHPSASLAQFDSTHVHPDSSYAPNLNWGRVAGTVGGLTATITAIHIYQNNAWWANSRTGFHVIEDADYQADYDKCGHMFGAEYSSYVFDQAYRWAGLDTLQANVFGALSGALWEYYVEI